jgi:outer membrane protein TolC
MPDDPRRPSSKRERNQSSQELKEDIRRRAYELYESRGREGGHELDDWVRAEQDVLNASQERR